MFTNIKFQKGKVTLLRRVQRSAMDKATEKLESQDPPRPEFGRALAAFRDWVCEAFELPADYAKRLQIIEIAIDDNDARGIVVTALRKVAAAEGNAILVTPRVGEDQGEKKPDKKTPVLPKSWVDARNELEREAAMFWDGDRAQQHLFQGANPHQPAGDDDDEGPYVDASETQQQIAAAAESDQLDIDEEARRAAQAEFDAQPFDAIAPGEIVLDPTAPVYADEVAPVKGMKGLAKKMTKGTGTVSKGKGKTDAASRAAASNITRDR